MYEVISYKNQEGWDKRIQQFATKDIYYYFMYSHLCHTLGDGEPYLFYYEDECGKMLSYVFLKRKIKHSSLWFCNELDGDYFDITTPSYGYGGPLYNEWDNLFLTGFRTAFEDYCKKERIVSEYIKFHPLLQNQHGLHPHVDVIYDRETVYIDLDKDEEALFHSYHKNHKRNIKKAQKIQLEFRVFQKEEALEQIEAFNMLYRETMDKLNASTYSYFSKDYFVHLLEGFEENSLIGAILYQGKMIAAALCLFEGKVLHYHLGCSKQAYLNLGTNPFLFHQLALWGKQKGLCTFHLGGGHSALFNGGEKGRDSLFHFKHRFNQTGILKFYIGRKIHLPEIHQKLISNWEKQYQQKPSPLFFPEYRSKPLLHI